MMIDRRSLVSRHNPRLGYFDFQSPLSLGNGEFVFTADASGLQSFVDNSPGATPLCSQAQWAWHSFPTAPDITQGSGQLRLTNFDHGGRSVGYAVDPQGQEALFEHLRVNPHRLNLFRLGFIFQAVELEKALASNPFPNWSSHYAAGFDDVDQELDLWSGCLHSRFSYRGQSYQVWTVCHPSEDRLACRIESPAAEISLLLAFPYGSPRPEASDWSAADRHQTRQLSDDSAGWLRLHRQLDQDSYFIELKLSSPSSVERVGEHCFLLRGHHELEVVISLSPTARSLTTVDWLDCKRSAARYWEEFWSTGGAVECAASRDPRALELERRIILSQYLTAINCTGSLPPQETGLVYNSWYGKFHLEMHYWHAAHFPVWEREALLERSLWYYGAILPVAQDRARNQGYQGARWPKMTDRSGIDSPSTIGPFLCWQQPHPIMYAELLYRRRPTQATLQTYADIVFASADFMASYAQKLADDLWHLTPPLIPAQENHDPATTIDPSFELAYWRWALKVAVNWRRRLALAPNATWQLVAENLAALPVGLGPTGRSVYLSHAACPDSFGAFATDHPSMLAAYGLLDGTALSPTTMSATLDAVLQTWDFETAWGWDFPMMAMTAARLGRRQTAVDALLMAQPKNSYLANGHNAQLPGTDLTVYLPGNGGLLLAVALMTVGWDGQAIVPATGQPTSQTAAFPDDGSWQLAWENIHPLP